MFFRRAFFAGWGFAAFVAFQSAGVEIKRPPETGFITLRAMSFDEAKELVEPFLSPEGRLGFARTRRLLVIHDYAENIRTIEEIIKRADSDPVNIRIQVSFNDVGEKKYGAIGVDIDDEHVKIHNRPRPILRRRGHTAVFGDVTVTGAAGRTNTVDFTSQSVLAGNGREARIWVGETVHDPVWVREYGCRHGWWTREMEFDETDLGASLWVRPRLLPDGTIDIEVYPKITARAKDGDRSGRYRRRSIAVKELSTRIVAANGQSVSIGGLDRNKRKAYAELFGVGKVFDGGSLTITLTPTVVRPPKARPAAAPKGKSAPAPLPARP